MTPHNLLGVGATALTVGAVATAAAVSSADSAHSAATPKITAAGVGKVKVGRSYKRLRKQHLVRKIGPGCELGGPNTRQAKLKKPLKGFVNFTLQAPRKVTDITIRGGATARGVGIGATIQDIKAKFPHAKVDHSTDETFAVTLVRIPKRDGGKFMFAVDTGTHRTTLIGVPTIGFCE